MTTKNIYRNILLLAITFFCPLIVSAADNGDDGNIYVWKKGSVVYVDKADVVDQVAYEQDKTVVTLYDADSAVLFTSLTSDVDSITFKYNAPTADMLDIKFNSNGTVEDASPMHNTVEIVSPSDTVPTSYNEVYGMYSGRFQNDWGSDATTYCKVDYQNNQEFKDGLSSGHTVETVFRAFYSGSLVDKECKWFAAMQSGGTGFLLCKKENGMNGGNEITFLPNVSTSGSSNWIWATSGVVPQTKVYYHVVGVWNQEEGKAYVYVNGELMNTVDAKGDFVFPSSANAQWFGIGCDANVSKGEQSGDWEIVTAKVYSYPLTATDVELMYNDIVENSNPQEEEPDEEDTTVSDLPEADLLDIVFNSDGTVEDASPMHNTVEIVSPTDAIPTSYNEVYGRYSGRFENTWGGDATTYCKVDYKNNEDFKDGLCGGHTVETLFRAFYSGSLVDKECKWFAAMQSGGTGFLLCKQENGMNGGNEITFLPNVSTSGSSNWVWATSGVEPQTEVYYHVVGVWNQEEGKAYVYVNGELMNTVDAEGELVLPSSSSAQWFGIGCDANASKGEQSGDWEIVTAKVYSYPLSAEDVELIYDDVVKSSTLPVADLLDVVFNSDGSAEDISPMQNEIVAHGDDELTVYYNEAFERNVAKFDNSWASAADAYYSMDYLGNQDFRNALADGHSLEALFMANYSGTISDAEAKVFSSHQSGGTGIMVCKKENGLNGTNEISFLPNVSTSGSSNWIWATSGVVPEPGEYYHVVGVWNKDEGKAYVYVNGELKNTVDAAGDYHFQSDSYKWFGIGADPGSNKAGELSWNGDVVIARIYDDPLTQRQVELLWNEVKDQQQSIQRMVTDVSFLTGISVKVGSKYKISGNGFSDGDVIKITSTTDESVEITLTCKLDGEDGVTITIPEGFESGKYTLTLVRSDATQNLGITNLTVVDEMPKGAEVIAHRGYWTDNAQNSRESLSKAQELGVYGSETDVWITTDDHLMINHDSSYNGVVIAESTAKECKNQVLANGENMPELTDFLEMIQTSESPTKLIIEIKSHSTTTLSAKAAAATVEAVKEYGVQDKVEYISYSQAACKQIIQDDPDAKVALLAGSVSAALTPAELQSAGYTGLDYDISLLRSKPEWVETAHDLGLTANVYTLTSISTITEMTDLGVDYITTDTPVDAMAVKEHYDNNYYMEEEEPDDGNTPVTELPEADLLNIVFNGDGTVEDASPMGNTVEIVSTTGTIPTTYSEVYGRYTGRFENEWGGDATTYCKVDYKNNEDFKDGLKGGHTVETLFRAFYSGSLVDKECKWFAAMQSGGTGFLLCKQTNGLNGGNEITFLPNVSTSSSSNWIWATSGVEPQTEVYYHVVGVWNQEEGKAYVYVNGELMNTVDAEGELVLPSSSGAQWFGIGCDANASKGEQSGDWEVVTAKVYSYPLTSSQVELIYNDIVENSSPQEEETPVTELPEADLLDIVFNGDGTVGDASPMGNTVEIVSTTGTIPTTYSEVYGRYTGRFENEWGGDATTYCKVDYKNNQEFKDGLKGGHTVETLFRAFYSGSLVDKECKWFAAMQSGGTGFLLCKQSNGLNGGNEITFLPNVSTSSNSNWVWATSGVEPQTEVYYHVVGVWNQEEGKAYVYVNGELMNTVDAEGELVLPSSSGAQWFGIGCDANASKGEQSGDWEVVTAKVYSYPLTSSQVELIYNDIVENSSPQEEETPVTELPEADLLDIVFNGDGTVEDASPMGNTVEIVSTTGTIPTSYSEVYGRYTGRFENEWGGDATTYCKVDYKNNEDFKDGLKGGHTVETLFRAFYSGSLVDKECKWFAAMQSGGTGFLLCKQSNGLNGGNELTFLPNVSTSGSSNWIWATSGVEPQTEVYYHLVGVWNQEEGKAYVYVNGELMNTVDAEGELVLPSSSGAQWFGIGCDANASKGEQSGDWEVVTAKVYSYPLTSSQVELIYDDVMKNSN